jgi:Tfp pilus assembly protein FimT
MVTLKLKENGRFKDRQMCFGSTEHQGTYTIQNDTIYFDYDDKENAVYKFAVLEATTNDKVAPKFDLIRFKGFNDKNKRSGRLYVIKNDLVHIK